MTKQTEALKLALEALESDPISHAGLVNTKKAITCVKEALAEDSSGTEQPAQPQQELCPSCKNGSIYACTCTFKPTQPQQEPVAWRVFDKDPFDGRDHRWVYFDKSEFVDGIDPTTHFNLEPVYTSPPAHRKPLHMGEEAAAFKEWFDAWWVGDGDICKAVTSEVEQTTSYKTQYTLAFGAWMAAKEAAHGIKGDA